MKKKIGLLALLAALAVTLSSCAYLPLLGLNLSGTTAAPNGQNNGDTVTISREAYERYQKVDVLLEAMDQVEKNFYQEVDENELIEYSIRGMFAGTGDYYSFYYSPEEYAEMWEDDEGEYAGIGIQINTNYTTNICTVSRVFENSPAAEKGVHRGDILYQVEDISVNSSTINDAVDVMRGTPGTSVHVVFLRNGEEIPFDIPRATININRVSKTMLDDQIGYICLYEFAGDCADKFIAAADELYKQGAKGIIIDLRDNGGGWVNDARSIADVFLDEGVLCYLENREGDRQYYYTRDGKTDVKLVILINENTASSSEILTGALRDRANAQVVGVKSFGKGIVQDVIPLSNGGGMQTTTAQYFTPNGYAVHKAGIEPDVEIALPEGDNGMYEFADLKDPQLEKAYEVMQGLIQ